jgi:hypothetical protein
MRVLAVAVLIAVTSLLLALPAIAAEDQPAGRTARFAALDTRLNELMRSDEDWSGSLRYRWQAERRTATFSKERFGQFLDFKLGYVRRLSPELEVGFRLSATDQIRFGADALHMFGADQFAPSSVALDRAFVHYSPEWAGTYEKRDGSTESTLDVVAGSLR